MNSDPASVLCEMIDADGPVSEVVVQSKGKQPTRPAHTFSQVDKEIRALVATKVVAGVPRENIAYELGITGERLDYLLSEPATQELISRQLGAARLTPGEMMTRLAPLAVTCVGRILLSNQVTVKDQLQAARFVIEQAHGRAVQKVEISSGIADSADIERVRKAIDDADKRMAALLEKRNRLMGAS